jgi:uncharacterized membrane protein
VYVVFVVFVHVLSLTGSGGIGGSSWGMIAGIISLEMR